VVVGERNAPSAWGEICGKQMWDDMRHKHKQNWSQMKVQAEDTGHEA